MIIIDLIYNLSVLVALSVLSGFIDSRYSRTTLAGKILQGMLFGGVAIIGMLYPFNFAEGIIFDGRSIVISLCTLFFGPVSGLISSASAMIFRNYLGGGGAVMGSLVITASFLIGYVFYRKKTKGAFTSTKRNLYVFGFLVSAVMMGLMLTLPTNSIKEAYKVITPTVMFFYPLITVLIGKMLLDQEENKDYLDKINQEKLIYQTTLYSIGDAVITTDKFGSIRHMNPVAEQLTGWKEKDAVGKLLSDVFNIIDEESRNKVRNPVKKIVQEGVKITLVNHTMLISKDGREIPIADSGAPIKNKTGDIMGAVIVFRDQTEERAARKTLIESETNFRNLFEHSPIGKSMTGVDGSLRANKALCAMLGYSEQELKTKKWMDITHPEDIQQTTEVVQSLLDGRLERSQLEKRFIHKNGNIIWADVSTYLHRTKNGMPQFFITTVTDITKRKEAEKALKESEEIFRHFMENSPIYVFFKDKEIRSLRLSKNYEQMLGKPLHELLGKTMDELFPSELAKKMIADDQRILHQGELVVTDEELNGRYYTTIKFPIIIDGIPCYLAGYTIDMTERKLAEEKLLESEERLSSFMNSASDSFYLLDSNMNFIEINKKGLEIIGKKREDVIGKNIADVVPDVKSSGRYEKHLEVIKTGTPYVVDHFIPHPIFGDLHFVLNSFKVGTGLGVIAHDITEHKRAEEALKQSNTFNEMLLQTIPFGMDIVDEKGNILFISDAMKKLLGSDALGQCCWTMFKDDKQQCHDCPLHRGIEFGRADVLESAGVLGGKTFQISHIGMTYQGKKAILEVFQDITEQKRLQSQFLQAQKNQSIGTLAGGIAHDFNNILGIILASSSALERSTENKEKILEYNRIIHQAVNRGAALVRQILTFARKTEIVLAPMILSDLISELVSMLEQTFPKIITFRKIFDSNIPFINADRTQIHQVLMNLCVNARDAMPKGGSITIKVEKQVSDQARERIPAASHDSYLCVSVTDTGEGMDEVTRRQIFDPFFTTKEQGKGTGLGLAVVYGVMQSHHGFIDVESEVGNGTTFRLYFPIPLASEQMADVSSLPGSFSTGGTETILLVEDEKALIEMVRLLLESKGYKVLTAKNGIEAVKIYKMNNPKIDIVLTDMGLPGITGMEAFKKIKEIDPNARVLFASGFFEPDIKSELYKLGAKGFIQKPYSPDEVLQKLREVLDEKIKFID